MAHRISTDISQNDRQAITQEVALRQVPLSGISGPIGGEFSTGTRVMAGVIYLGIAFGALWLVSKAVRK
jgi:hypothetical protein